MERARNNHFTTENNIATIKTSEVVQKDKTFKQHKLFIGRDIVHRIEDRGIKIDYWQEWFDEGLIHLVPNGGDFCLLYGSRLTLNRFYVKKYKIRDGKYKMKLNDDGSIDIDLTEKVSTKK